MANTDTSEVTQVLKNFVTAVLTGEQQELIEMFYEFGIVPGPGKIQWPIFYLERLLNLFPDGKDLNLTDLINRDLCTYASRTGSGLDWELIVQVAILLQCLNAKLNNGDGPFGIVGAGEEVSTIVTLPLFDNVTDVNGANIVLNEFMYSSAIGTIVVSTPTYSSFPIFDGFVYFKESNQNVVKIGYQVKLGRAYPTSDVPDFLHSGVLVRGRPPSKSGERGSWKYYSDYEIDNLLGASLQGLKPSVWPEHPQQDTFN